MIAKVYTKTFTATPMREWVVRDASYYSLNSNGGVNVYSSDEMLVGTFNDFACIMLEPDETPQDRVDTNTDEIHAHELAGALRRFQRPNA